VGRDERVAVRELERAVLSERRVAAEVARILLAALPDRRGQQLLLHAAEGESFVKWRTESASGFLIAVKASRYITHIRRLRDCRDPVSLFWSRARKLGAKLGPVLFQLPPRFGVDLDRLRAFLKVLPKPMRPAFEFRDSSWENEDVYGLLDHAGAAYVLADRPGWRMSEVVTGGWSYIRFHQGRQTSPFYSRAKLRRWADHIASLPANEVYLYFNNDELGAAIKDAPTMMELLADRGLDVPGM
jgi:uncharacterized protein YecE (DUF72 family)